MTTAPSLETVFFAALEIGSSEERAAYLDAACAGAPHVRQRVEKMLAAQVRAGRFLEIPPAAPALVDDADRAVGERAGSVIGPYTLIEPIGEGGFGVVFRAEQTAPVRRQVALKVLKAGMDSRQVVARFEAERQALALMDHPNIARVFDGGETAAGRPFFVMELVKGVPITDYCDQHQLPPRDRLGLFVQVCAAVQHAHQKGVIHRDLKPSNVLVAADDGTSTVKVIDFGVAKAVGPRLTEQTIHTGLGAVVGTVEYMSPEQAGFHQLDVDTRSDIYALGVLLFELLTGTTPLARASVEKSGLLEALRVVREDEAPTLSHRLAETAELPALAARRGLAPRQLANLVRGELDWIVMKALEKDRTRRYETANGFALDVQRYLADEPVQACPPSAAYRIRKFVRRNRGRLAATAALALVAIAGIGAVWVAEARATRARAVAETDRTRREAWTTASVTAALREAGERAEEAWTVSDHPDRMQRATDAAIAAVRRADDFAAGGSLTEATRAELDASRAAVDALTRHTRLITTIAEHSMQFADEGGLGASRAGVNLCSRYREALREFGLDPVDQPIDDVALMVVHSRIRDALLGMLLDWRDAAAPLAALKTRPAPRSVYAHIPAEVVVVSDRLESLARATRQQCGGPYARWQHLNDRNDVPGLVEFAASPEALSFRSSLVTVLGRDLVRAKELQAARTYLRAAVDRYPHDVLLHSSLAGVCNTLRPPGTAADPESLRHLAAASALRPDSARFHSGLAEHYTALRLWDQAATAFRKAVALNPSHWTYARLAFVLRQLKDWDGVVAAWREAARLDPDYLGYRFALRMALADAGRHVEAADELAAIRKNPAWIDDPRSNVRFVAACDAIRSANGLVANPSPPGERPKFRKQALALLTAELDAMRTCTDTDRALVHRTMQSWLSNLDLSWAREPIGLLPQDMLAAWNRMPLEERETWNKLWADVSELRDRTAPQPGTPKAAK